MSSEDTETNEGVKSIFSRVASSGRINDTALHDAADARILWI